MGIGFSFFLLCDIPDGPFIVFFLMIYKMKMLLRKYSKLDCNIIILLFIYLFIYFFSTFFSGEKVGKRWRDQEYDDPEESRIMSIVN